MTADGRNLAELRIEEGRKLNIGNTVDPLDGTWTTADPMLVKALQDEYLRDASVVIVMVPAMAGVMTMVIDVYVGFIVAIIALIVTIWASCLYMLRKAAQVANGHMFRVTDEELVIKHGDGTKVTSMIPLADIVEVGVVETKYSAKYGLKSVYVDTGGFGGQTMMGLRDAESVAEAILSRVKKAQAITKAA